MIIARGDHVSKTYPNGVTALRDVSVAVPEGTVLAVVGESGSGKSTLARLMCGLLAPDTGTVALMGTDIAAVPSARRAHLVQMIFQDPFSSLNPKLSIGTQWREAAGDNFAEIPAMIERMELPPSVLRSFPHQLSGGQCQRSAIARALLKRPRFLIADEPLSALDVSTQRQILRVFQGIQKEHRTGFLFVTHDLAVASAVADTVMILRQGSVIEAGNTDTILRAPASPYTRALLDAVPRIG